MKIDQLKTFHKVAAAEAFLETLCTIGIFSHGENLRNLLGDHRRSPV